MLILNLVSYFGQNPKPRYGIHLELPNYLSFRLFLSSLKSFTYFILFGLCKVLEKQKYNRTQNSYNFFNRQNADKKLKTPAKNLCCKNVFVNICYIAKQVFCINISNNSPKLVDFWLDQLVFSSRKEIISNSAAKKSFLATPK